MKNFAKAVVYAVCLWLLIAFGLTVLAYFAFAWRAQGVETLIVGLLGVSLVLTGVSWVLIKQRD